MSRWEDEETVLRLACLTESRADSEQRCMLRIAARLDHEHNRQTTTAIRQFGVWDPSTVSITAAGVHSEARQLKPLSALYDLVQDTRVIEEGVGEHFVVLRDVEEKRAREAARQAKAEA